MSDMRFFSVMTSYGNNKNIVIYNGSEIEEAVWMQYNMYVISKVDYEKYKKYLNSITDEDEEMNIYDWLENNDVEYKNWCEEWIKANKIEKELENENVIIDSDNSVFNNNSFEYSLIYEYWDGSNWKIIELENPEGDSCEITDEIGKLGKVAIYTGEYNEYGEWGDYKTGETEIYKSENNNYYKIYSSYYQGELDEIEEITLDEIKEKFDEDFESEK